MLRLSDLPMTWLVLCVHSLYDNVSSRGVLTWQLFRILVFINSIINNVSVLDATFSIGVDDKRVCESFIFDRSDGLNISKNNGISLFLG